MRDHPFAFISRDILKVMENGSGDRPEPLEFFYGEFLSHILGEWLMICGDARSKVWQ